jgi:hypothetical protein
MNYINIGDYNCYFVFYLDSIKYDVLIPYGQYRYDTLITLIQNIMNSKIPKTVEIRITKNDLIQKNVIAVYQAINLANPFRYDGELYMTKPSGIVLADGETDLIISGAVGIPNGEYTGIVSGTKIVLNIPVDNLVDGFGGSMVKILFPRKIDGKILQIDFESDSRSKVLARQLGFTPAIYGNIGIVDYKYISDNQLIYDGYAIIRSPTLDLYTNDNMIGKVHMNQKYVYNREYSLLTAIKKDFDGYSMDVMDHIDIVIEDYKGNPAELNYFDHNMTLEITEINDQIEGVKTSSKYVR